MEHPRIRRHGGSQCRERCGASAGHPQTRQVDGREPLRSREDGRQPGRDMFSGLRQGLAMRRDELSRKPPRRRHRDLLAENRAYRHLEAVPCPWQAQPGAGGHEGGEPRILREVRRDRADVGAEVEHPPDATIVGSTLRSVKRIVTASASRPVAGVTSTVP